MGEPIQTVGPLAGICGYTGTSWEKILIDASKRLVVAIAAFTASLEVTQDTPGDLLTGIHGYIGSTWQKQPLQFGYANTIGEGLSNTNLSVGTNFLYGTTVPSGEVWVVTFAAILYQGTAPTNLQIVPDIDSVGCPAQVEYSPVNNRWVFWNGVAVMAEGDRIFGRCDGATAGDDMYFRYNGYKFEIDL